VAWLVAIGLAHGALKPIRRLTREVEGLRQGRPVVGPELDGEEEFKELAAQTAASQSTAAVGPPEGAGDNVQVQHVVDQLEDGCIFLTRDRRILFVNKAAEVVLGKPIRQIQGWRLDEVLEPSHPLRSLLSEDEDDGDRRSTTIVLRRDGRPREFVASRFAVADAERSMGTMVLLKDLESIKTLRSLLSYSTQAGKAG